MSLSESVLEGKYEVVRPISEGGMGKVYLVRHRHLDALRVVKTIRQQHAGDADLQKRFLLEARAAIRARHARIAETYDFSIDDDGTAYIVMEYIEGKTLQQILRQTGPPPLPYVFEIAIQTLEGLDFLHRRGYIHRDVAPDNAMLTRDFDGQPQVKLIDLGIAKRIGEKTGAGVTASGMFLGKARYSSPEQFGRGEVDQRSDIYSFGVVLYELLTGWCPLQGTTLSQLISAHLFERPIDFDKSDPDKQVPSELRALVLQSLAKDPSQRISTAADFIRRLRHLRAAYCPEPDWSGLETLLADAPPEPADLIIDPTQPMTTPTQPRDPRLIPRALLEARQQIEDGRLEEARDGLRRFLVTEPGSEPARELLNVVDDRLQQIADSLKGAITRRAEHIESLLAEGFLRKARGELEQALAEFGEVELLRSLKVKIDEAVREHDERRQQRATERRLELERQQKIVERETQIRQLLQQGELERADAELAAAMGELGAALAWDELLQELERLLQAREKLKRQALKKLEAARQQLEAGDLEAARRKALVAAQLDDSEAVQHLLREIDEAERAVEEEQRREQRRQAASAKVEWAIAAGDFEGASRDLDDSRPLFEAGDERLAQLRERIASQQLEIREAQSAELLLRARRYREEQDFEHAADAVREAMALEPDNQEAQRLMLELDAEFQAWVREQARLAAGRQAIEEVEGHIRDRRLEEAGAALDRLAADHEPDAADLERLRADLEEQRQAVRKEREKQIAELLQEAQAQLEQQAFDDALERVQTALALDSESAGLRYLLREIESACQEAIEKRPAEDGAATEPSGQTDVVAKIESFLDRGNVTLARQLLTAAERDYGAAPFSALRQRLEDDGS